MGKRLGCLHAHYSNIEYLESTLATYDVELIHFVDPGLMYRVTADERFQESAAQNKVTEQMEWIAQCNVDAILITCTNYIAILAEEPLSISIPILKIDEPFFECICNITQPQSILFTNPATVKGTMERLQDYAKKQHKSLHQLKVMVMDNMFELLMQGRIEEYNQEISRCLKRMITEEQRDVSVAQLSMVHAAQLVELETSKTIVNPLNTLLSSLVQQLAIEKKRL